MKDNHVAAVLEDIDHKIDLIIEMYQETAGVQAKVHTMSDEAKAVRASLKTTQVAVKDVSKQVAGHQQRISRLESLGSLDKIG